MLFHDLMEIHYKILTCLYVMCFYEINNYVYIFKVVVSVVRWYESVQLYFCIKDIELDVYVKINNDPSKANYICTYVHLHM